MSELVTIDFKFPNLLENFKSQFKNVLIGMASDVQTNRGLLFDGEGAFNGHEKWKDLASGKNKKILKNGLQARQILRKSGVLRLSLAPSNPDGTPGQNGYIKVEGDYKNVVMKVGTLVAYAKIHNEGGVIMHPGTDNGFGRGIKIKAHPITIPKRNFTDWNEIDARNMKKYLKNVAKAINGE